MMPSPKAMNPSVFIIAGSALFLVPALRAQQSGPAPSSSPADAAVDVTKLPRSGRIKDKELPQISVIDKLLAVEAALGARLNRTTEAQWTRDYNELYQRFRKDGTPARIRGEGTSASCNALALGVKACDAVMALKARNIEALKDASDQVEELARKLGVTQGEMSMADTVKFYANRGQWYNAFLALGRLQRDVLNYLRSNPEKIDLAALTIVGGWLQGGRCVTHVVDRHYDEAVSNVLREQRLVSLIIGNMEKLAPVHLNEPLVAEIMKTLPEIYKRVDVGLRDPVSHENVLWLHQTFDHLVDKIMTSEKAVDSVPEGEGESAAAVPPSGQPAGGAAAMQPALPASGAPAPATGPVSPPVSSGQSSSSPIQGAQAKADVRAAGGATPGIVARPADGKPGGRSGWLTVGGVLALAVGLLIVLRRKGTR